MTTYIAKWPQSDFGKYALNLEKKVVSTWISKWPGRYLLQIGDPFLSHLSDHTLVQQRILLEPNQHQVEKPLAFCQGFAETLPFDESSIDVVFLAHALEVVSHPKEVLQEIHRVLIPEGYLLITGFQPSLFWNLYHQTIGLNRLRAWLLKNNFEVVSGQLFGFMPLSLQFLGIKWPWLEKIGPVVCPFLSTMYAIVVKKRCITLTPVKPSWQYSNLWQNEWMGDAAKWSLKNGRKNES